MLMRPGARFDLARRIRSPEGAPIGEVFTFLSGLYFRGKLAYARRFHPEAGGVFVITSSAGLVAPETPVTVRDLQAFARVPIATSQPDYRRAMERDVRRLATAVGADAEFVLLGSIATDKYSAVLLDRLGERLLFPGDFVGRGDMSRGGLLLRAAREGLELRYVPVGGGVRHGPRPARLDPRTRVRE